MSRRSRCVSVRCLVSLLLCADCCIQQYPIKPHGRKYTKHRAGLLASSLHSSEWRGPPQPLNVLRNGADDVDKMSTDDEQENAPRIKVADTFIVGWRKEQSAFVGLVNEVTNGFERDESEAMEVE